MLAGIESNTYRITTVYRLRNCCELALVLIYVGVNRLSLAIYEYLARAEGKEADPWYREDLRIAQLVVELAYSGEPKAYSVAFLRIYGRKPEQVTSWWRDRSALLRLAQACGSATPLLHVNQAQEVLAVIPDYDPSLGRPSSALGPADYINSSARAGRERTSPGSGADGTLDSAAVPEARALPPKKPAAAATTSSGETAAGRKKAL